MTIAVLYPRREYAETAEQTAAWQTLSRLRRGDDVAEVVYYDDDEPAADVAADVFVPHVLVVLDPLAIVERAFAARLRAQLAPGASVVVPVQPEPLVYLCTLETLRHERRPLRQVLDGRALETATVSVQRWKRPVPPDLLPFIPPAARALLHVGCGDGTLGEQIKRRQRCRVVGIERSRELASAARRRLDDVYIGDVAEIVPILHEPFDCILASGLEQGADPWSLLAGLRHLTAPGGTLITSIPNVAHAAVVADLLEGHFEVAKQMRFFTRESVEELMDIAGWNVESIATIEAPDERLPAALRAAQEDLSVAWFIVTTRHEG
ncbi:MAG TPA: methyltransferase domain-containing protein [Thermoanaerobaculia bacterium]|nr:methyltransferase domain-containing protein [Thermoanaerobaculia bacterium]